MVTGGNPLDEVRKKGVCRAISEWGFILHKWNSNVSALDSDDVDTESELTYGCQTNI